MPAAKSSNVSESGSRRTPVATADSPEAEGEEQRDDEEDSGLDQEEEEERDNPVAQLDVAQHGRVDEHGQAALDAAALPHGEEGEQDATRQHEPDHR